MEHKNVKITKSDKTSAVGLADALMHGGVIEGKAKIILTDERNGKKEVIEQKNLVTNAVKRIFGNNWMMNADVSSLIPMEKLFGGILCFQNAFANPDADMVCCPNDDENPMIACAGDLAHATVNPYRGNPNALASSVASDLSSITRVWEWQTLQGVGTIGSLALTSAICGNMGLKPIDDEFCPINTASNSASDAYMFADENQSSTQTNTWNETTARRRPMWIDKNNPHFGYTVAVIYTGALQEIVNYDIVAIKMEQAFLKTAMFSGISEYKEVSRTTIFSVSIAQFTDDPSWYTVCDDDNYVYIVRAYGGVYTIASDYNAHIVGWKISKADWSYSQFDYNVSDALETYFMGIYPDTQGWNKGINTWNNSINHNDHIADNWIMQNGLPCNNGQLLINCYVRNHGYFALWIPIDHNPSASELQQVKGISQYARTSDIRRGVNSYWSPSAIKVGNRMYVMVDENRAYFINGSKAYPCGIPARPNGHYTSTTTADPDGIVLSTPETFPSMMFSSFSKSGRLKTRSGYCHSNVYLATINNLENSVEKQNTMSMRIEYSLTVT